jgi:hypothetical protein
MNQRAENRIIFPGMFQITMMFTRMLPNVIIEMRIDDEGNPEIEIAEGLLYITGGWMVTRKSIGGSMAMSGFRVWTVKTHPGNRDNPPEQEDVTIAEEMTAGDAFAAAVKELAMIEWDRTFARG